jgi:hypothetical protein
MGQMGTDLFGTDLNLSQINLSPSAFTTSA